MMLVVGFSLRRGKTRRPAWFYVTEITDPSQRDCHFVTCQRIFGSWHLRRQKNFPKVGILARKLEGTFGNRKLAIQYVRSVYKR